MSSSWKNILLLLGTIIGAGIFSLPIVLAKSGIVAFVMLLLLIAYFMGKINIFFREIVDSYETRHQLPGYVKLILGEKAALISLFFHLFSLFGALLAYLILGGGFVANTIGSTPEIGSLLFFTGVTLILFFAGRALESFDMVFSFLKLLLLTVVVCIGFSYIKAKDVGTIALFGTDYFTAYGAILFALTGFSIVPELSKINRPEKSIYVSQGISALLYMFFAFALVFFVNGEHFVVGNNFTQTIFNVAGFFTVFTPYLILSLVIYDVFKKDLTFSHFQSLILTVTVPAVFYLAGAHSFSKVISVTGGVFLGAIAIIIARMYQKKFPGRHTFVVYLIQVLFILGMIGELLVLFR